MVYAIATLDSVVLYDTSSTLPLAAFCQIHFDSITDLSWSSDGNLLAVSSRDCFCTLVSFQQGELGEPIDLSELPEHIRNIMAKDSFTRAPQNGTIQENIDNQEALEQHATLSALDRQRESPSQPQQVCYCCYFRIIIVSLNFFDIFVYVYAYYAEFSQEDEANNACPSLKGLRSTHIISDGSSTRCSQAANYSVE